MGYVARAITPLSTEFADEVSLMNSWVVTPWNKGALMDSSTDTNRYHALQIYMLWCPLSQLKGDQVKKGDATLLFASTSLSQGTRSFKP